MDDLTSLIVGNLLFSVMITPTVVLIVGILRGLVLLTGQKREFEDWTRNPLLTILSIVFLPGSVVFVTLRYIIAKIGGIDVEDVSGSATYGELDLFLRIEKPPRVGVVLTALYVTIVASVFTAMALITIPVLYLLSEPPLVIICWYVAVSILFNTSVRSGDISIVVASLKRHPRSGTVELIVVLSVLVILYTQVFGVIV